jgi:glutamate-1-semialdehyde aminotransferase
MAIAVRIARAATGKDTVLFCGYHGWSDWYLSANLADKKALDGQLLPGLEPAGVPRGLKGTAYPFRYNETREFLSLIESHEGDVAAVVIEAVRNVLPTPEFLEAVRGRTRQLGIPLIVDEVSSGFRMNLGGAHLVIGLEPDVAVFAKGMSNGYPMAAVIGRQRYMEAAQSSFISSTYWTERVGPAAALATIRKMRKVRAQERMMSVGRSIQEGWQRIAAKRALPLTVSGIYPLSHFEVNADKPLVFKTLFTQEMLKRGFLATNGFYSCWAHSDEDVRRYLAAADEVFGILAKAASESNAESLLKGPVCHSGFRRLA